VAVVLFTLLYRLVLLRYLIHILIHQPNLFNEYSRYIFIITLPTYWILISRGCYMPICVFISWIQYGSYHPRPKSAINTELPPKRSQSATELSQVVKPAEEVFDIFYLPTETRSLGSIPHCDVFVKMSTFIVPQEGDGITWNDSVILAPREIDEIALVLGDAESGASENSTDTQYEPNLGSGDNSYDSTSTQAKAELSIKSVGKDRSKLAVAVGIFITLADQYNQMLNLNRSIIL
jgi:hypothetical protein